ncbi:MAG: ethanolamine ammonia-lyase subunit EutC [Tepidisphaeraceae bacterium]
MTTPLVHPDPWSSLRRHTSARIAIGRTGGSLPTAEVLAFAMDHAEARDAVDVELDIDELDAGLAPFGVPVVRLVTQAPDHATYLRRPDLGRKLDADSAERVSRLRPDGGADVCLIVGDGLSALAATRQAPALLAALAPMLRESRLTLAPLSIVRHARVAVQDQIGSLLGARVALILLGERPGLGTPDSLGAYLVFDPKPGNTDANRNCVSNIRPGGLPPDRAAHTLHHLLVESVRRRISGTKLKDERAPALGAGRIAGMP